MVFEDHSVIIKALREGLIEHEASDTGGVPRWQSSCPDRLAEATDVSFTKVKLESQKEINYYVYPTNEQDDRVENPGYVHTKRDHTLNDAGLLALYDVSTMSCVLSLRPLNLACCRLGRWLTVGCACEHY